MDRRLFVSRMGSMAALLSTSGLLGLSGCSENKKQNTSGASDEIPTPLQASIAHLGSSHFAEYAVREDALSLYQVLLQKGVVTDTGEYIEASVAAIAPTDDTLQYREFYYTQTEMELYSLALLLNGAVEVG